MFGWQQEVILRELTELGVCVVSIHVPPIHTCIACVHAHTHPAHLPRSVCPQALKPVILSSSASQASTRSFEYGQKL